MGIRSLSLASIANGTKRSKAWDQSAGSSTANSFESIATVTLGSSTSTVVFSSIPQTYKHLQLRSTFYETSDGDVQMTFNNDTTLTNYSCHRIVGNSSSTATGENYTTNEILYMYPANTASYRVLSIIDFPDYSSTTKFKTQIMYAGVDTNGAGVIDFGSQNWRNNNAISRIQLYANGVSKTFGAGSKFALYGMKG